ncbi:MAG: ABC transporter permease subunit [Actinomycetes bacterium]
MSATHDPLVVTSRRTIHRGWILLGILAIWFALGHALRGRATFQIGVFDQTSWSTRIGDAASSIRGNREHNPIFNYVFDPIRTFINGFVTIIRHVISLPIGKATIPLLGWLGVLALIVFVVYITSNVRMALLAALLIFGCGALGMWTDSMDTLALTITAVLMSLAIGIPLGIWGGLSDVGLKILTPILDLAQILPTLVYLAPLALFFLIGPASATIATMVYCIPIAIRITAFGIRGVPHSPVEAGTSMGTTTRQLLSKVQLPMAARTLVLGVNQTTLAALSFAVIATLIGAPGLGKPVINALVVRNVGNGFVAGLAVVLLAIMLDRSTSASVKKRDSFVPASPEALKRRRIGKVVAAVLTIVAMVLSRQFAWAAYFPKQAIFGKSLSHFTDSVVAWTVDNLGFWTTGLNKVVTIGVLNPLEAVLSESPWFVTTVAVALISFVLGGVRSAIVTSALLLGIVATGLWYDTMITFTQTIVATLLTMVVGVILGVWIGRSERVDRVLRPFLDAGQVLPAFVYLIPILGFFGPSRFTGIATGIVYSIPIVVKIVGEGIRDVPKTIMEAATSSGATKWQLITKVQLPAAKNSLLLATNQGLIFVLAVVVIGGFVGSGGLGYMVILGGAKPEMQGKGLLAGLAILLLGVMIDRVAQYAVRRNSAPKH